MQTQTHALLALALFAKSEQTARNWAVFAGAMATDAFIYIGFLWYVGISGQSAQDFFSGTYFDSLMQFWSALSNSLPLYALLAGLGFALRQHRLGALLLFFALAAFTQSAIDLPVHADDAHRHFWPLTDWRFISPLSYWDPAHYGRIIGPLDALLGMICALFLWRRFPKRWVRILLGLLIAFYALMSGLTVASLL